ncbi:ABC transporter permease [Acuticoccus sediminis]|uniref:ABC transporter permease n=2 Tax=Acuticoccus sediminis TaxID=2184697 RepID=A0A8B2NLD5_9HYPH|nr:ABC transporter permease [Acuticoccus sediminis]
MTDAPTALEHRAALARPRVLSPRLIATALSVAAFFALWLLGTWWMGPRLCPSPVSVFGFIASETASGELPYHLGVTLARVAAAFVIAMAVGTAAGLAMGRSTLANTLGEPWLILLLNAPALIVIVLAYIWIGLTESAAILAVALNKIPNVTVTIREGARAMDPALMEMAKVYRFSRGKTLANVTLPQLQPYIAAAARSGIALIWKIVLVVELLGRSNGVGFQIHLYFQMFDVRAILGYTLAFVAIMLVVEFFIVQPLEARANRWRPRPV